EEEQKKKEKELPFKVDHGVSASLSTSPQRGEGWGEWAGAVQTPPSPPFGHLLAFLYAATGTTPAYVSPPPPPFRHPLPEGRGGHVHTSSSMSGKRSSTGSRV